MKTYQITSSAGVNLGTYDGETEADAIVAMWRAAGYRHAAVVDGEPTPGAGAPDIAPDDVRVIEVAADDRDGCHSCHSLAPVAGLLCAECGHAVERHGATVADAYAVECDCDAHLHDTLAATHAAHDGDCDCEPAAVCSGCDREPDLSGACECVEVGE